MGNFGNKNVTVGTEFFVKLCSGCKGSFWISYLNLNHSVRTIRRAKNREISVMFLWVFSHRRIGTMDVAFKTNKVIKYSIFIPTVKIKWFTPKIKVVLFLATIMSLGINRYLNLHSDIRRMLTYVMERWLITRISLWFVQSLGIIQRFAFSKERQ